MYLLQCLKFFRVRDIIILVGIPDLIYTPLRSIASLLKVPLRFFGI